MAKDVAALRDKVSALLWWAAGLFVLMSLASYHPHDLAWETSSVNPAVKNLAGQVGAVVAYLGLKGLGWAAYLVPLLCALWGWWRFQGWARQPLARQALSGAVLIWSVSALAATPPLSTTLRMQGGGVVGLLTSSWLMTYFGRGGAYLLELLFAALSAVVTTELVVLSWLAYGYAQAKAVLRWTAERWLPSAKRGAMRPARTTPASAETIRLRSTVMPKTETPTILKPIPVPEPPREVKISGRVAEWPSGPKITAAGTSKTKSALAPPSKKMSSTFQLPSLDLLHNPPPASERQLNEDLETNARILEDALRDFGIEATVEAVDRGPIITRYELQPAPGVKVNKITALADDIALVMKATSVRIVAPIPGKARVGVEMPNATGTIVVLKEVLQSQEFQQSESKLTLAIGKDVAGQPLVCDLEECPHVLIAGTTGSGKTVCINSILAGLACNATPDELKLLLIDPKMVELAPFNEIPHLLAPVVTEAKKAAHVLQWAVTEMEERYRLFARLGVRNIGGYNSRIHHMGTAGSPSQADEREEPLRPMPYLVIVIDELADLMLVASQQVEESITRLAQLSRAVGIHIVLATQRPSVDVITGVIKANFPARISFQVASKVDSRTVLDMNGADKLLGKGDLLFLRPGTSKPIRGQGCLVTDMEIEMIVNHLKQQGEPEYEVDLLKPVERNPVGLHGERDELYDEAKRVVLETGQASTSMLQRRLRLGYTRAARLIDMMEEEGMLGPFRGAKPREILVERPQPAVPPHGPPT